MAAVGIDGALLRDLSRAGIDWRLDPRVPAGQQTGEAVYARNDLDRGHLVRRADAVWGATEAEAQQGNEDTFFLTNAALQAAAFNQGEELWLGLEDHLLGSAAGGQRRLVVLTGPVLAPTDPGYRGVQVPLRFWKLAAFVDGGELAAVGHVLDQTALVGDLLARATDPPPPPGAFRTFQVSITDIAALTGLDLDQLAAVDRLPAVPGRPGSPACRRAGCRSAPWPRCAGSAAEPGNARTGRRRARPRGSAVSGGGPGPGGCGRRRAARPARGGPPRPARPAGRRRAAGRRPRPPTTARPARRPPRRERPSAG